MKTIQLPYGNTKLSAFLSKDDHVILPNDMNPLKNPREEIRKKIKQPIGTPPLSEICRGKEKIVIVINDITRPSPSDLFVEEILAELELVGIHYGQITLLVATGNHRPNTNEELKSMVGEQVYNRLKIVQHNCEDQSNLVDYGYTKRGLPIIVNRLLAEADVRILTGIITPHQSAGYSGGRKSIMPGVAGIKSLVKHHSFPIRSYEPILGEMNHNPFHEESVEAAQRVGVDFILNVIKNSKQEIVAVVAGDLIQAHEEGVKICDHCWKVNVNHFFDIVVTSPGGYPKDIDLHQSQKAISTAELVVKEGGVIILVAECRDGVGKFGKWLQDAREPQEVIDNFIKIGFTPDHSSKAFMLARALHKAKIILVNPKIEHTLLKDMFFECTYTIDEALQRAYDFTGNLAKKLFIPYANDCIPVINKT